MTGFESLGFGYSNLPRHQKGGCTQDRDNEGIIAQHGPVTGCASCKNTAWHGPPHVRLIRRQWTVNLPRMTTRAPLPTWP